MQQPYAIRSIARQLKCIAVETYDDFIVAKTGQVADECRIIGCGMPSIRRQVYAGFLTRRRNLIAKRTPLHADGRTCSHRRRGNDAFMTARHLASRRQRRVVTHMGGRFYPARAIQDLPRCLPVVDGRRVAVAKPSRQTCQLRRRGRHQRHHGRFLVGGHRDRKSKDG